MKGLIANLNVDPTDQLKIVHKNNYSHEQFQGNNKNYENDNENSLEEIYIGDKNRLLQNQNKSYD